MLEQQRSVPQTVKKMLAVDYGGAFSGFATNAPGGVPRSLGVHPSAQTHAVIQQHVLGVDVLALGLPISDDGTENQLCTDIRSMGALFKKQVRVVYVSERMSTQGTGPQRHQRTDDMAAIRILQWAERTLQNE